MVEAMLRERVETLFTAPERSDDAKTLLAAVRQRLREGTLRVAEPAGRVFEDETREWSVNVWVKKAILLMGNIGELQRVHGALPESYGVEMDTLPWRHIPPAMCRFPLGNCMREGAFLSPGITCMPPSVLQIGCHVGPGTAIDSMVNIGIGAQIGSSVQLSCGVTIGGWIAPLDDLPTIIEDLALLGSGSGVYDGAQVGRGAILMAGTQIIPSLGILDLKSNTLLRRQGREPLRVPPYAVVAMGTRLVAEGVALQIPVIVGRRLGKNPQEWEHYSDISFTA